jgi:nicotinamidase-related amidase
MGELKDTISAKAQHLCIDMQVLFSSQGPWPARWMERVLPVVLRLVERAPAQTIFTRFITPAHPDETRGMWRSYYRKWANVTRDTIDPQILSLMPELQRFTPPAMVFDKMVYSAFADGRLHKYLHENSVDTLIISGSETDVCVLSSVLAAVDYGYRIILARDGVCSSSDNAHDASLALYRQRFDLQVELAESQEILEAWRR